MERRKFLIGAGSLAAGSAAAMGTGAFTTVEADRTVSVNVTGDESAYLKLAASSGPNSEYVETDGNGELQLNLDDLDESDASGSTTPTGSPNGGQGVNPNSYTKIHNPFIIQNQGTQGVGVSLTGSTGDVTIGSAPSDPDPTESDDQGVYIQLHDGVSDKDLGTGDTTHVNVEVVAGPDTDSLSGSLTIEAAAEDYDTGSSGSGD